MIIAKGFAGVVALAALASVGSAHAHWYAGVGAGAVRLDPKPDVGLRLEDNGRDTGFKAVLGKRIGKKSRVEFFYAPLGTAEFAPDGSVEFTGYGLNTVWSVAKLKKGHRSPRVFVSAGVGALDIDAEDASTSRDHELMILGGVGVEYPLRRGLSARAALEVFDRDAAMLSATLLKSFGKRGHHAPASTSTPVAAVAAEVTPRVEATAEPVVVADSPVASESVVQLQQISFNRDSAYLTEQGQVAVRDVVATLRQYPKMRIEIQGHADASESGNALALSELRAQRVGNRLWREGVSPERLALVAYGDSQPASGEVGDPLNRRVQFRILNVD